MPYETFDHTGDIGIRVSADTCDELFATAAGAFTDTVTEPDRVGESQMSTISMAAADLDLLFVDWLSELLYRFETSGWLTRRAEVAIDRGPDGCRLHARLYGETLDPARHPIKVLVKAVTYHTLRVEQGATGWAGSVVFDI